MTHCGHPPDPVAREVEDGWACHCGLLLNGAPALSDGKRDDAPGPIVACAKCGCYVAIPPTPASGTDEVKPA